MCINGERERGDGRLVILEFGEVEECMYLSNNEWGGVLIAWGI